MEQAVRAQERASVDAAAPIQVRGAAAGLLDEQHRSGGVPGREFDLDHRLGGTLSDQGVTPEVAEAAFPPDIAQEAVEPGRPTRRHDVPAGPVQDLGILQP